MSSLSVTFKAGEAVARGEVLERHGREGRMCFDRLPKEYEWVAGMYALTLMRCKMPPHIYSTFAGNMEDTLGFGPCFVDHETLTCSRAISP